MRVLLFISLSFIVLFCGCSNNIQVNPSAELSGNGISEPSPLESNSPGHSSANPSSSMVPGDYSLQTIIEAAEKHLNNKTFEDVPQNELESAFPSLYQNNLEVRGRKDINNVMYVVFKKQSDAPKGSISDILGITLNEDAQAYASQNGLEFSIQLDSIYGVAAFGKGETSKIAEAVKRSCTGEYINKYL